MHDSAHSEPTALDAYRSYLILLARLSVGPRRNNQFDASDVVQQTLMEAFQAGQKLPTGKEALCAWLRQALANNIRDRARYENRQKRDQARERSLDVILDQSSLHLAQHAASLVETPSQEAIRAEQAVCLAHAIEQLPQSQREAIILHHLQGHSLSETAELMDKSQPAVAGLLHRGLRVLRVLLNESQPKD